MGADTSITHALDENARRRFEAAWQEGRPELIENHLPPENDPAYLVTLEELVHIELEFAWKYQGSTVTPAENGTGTPPCVEGYLKRFPSLNQPMIVRRLAQQEFEVRRRYGDNPSSDEFHKRFADFEFTEPTLDAPRLVPLLVTNPQLPKFPGYEVLDRLGRGGMGIVFKARHAALNRIVALKMLLGGALAREEDVIRFRHEGQAIASLQHPNIVQIYEIGDLDGRPYFAMEFVNGGTLAGRLAGKPQPPHRAAQLVEVLARAIHCAHTKGIVHRDLKPANVLLHFDEVAGTADLQAAILKITDFGLAKRLEGDLGQTHTGDVLGTPRYMAPEQATGNIKEIGPGTDVYSLGVILYEMVTGRSPFHAESVAANLQQILSEEPVAPRRLQAGIPRDLETICLKCLEKESRRRYVTAEALADDLERFCLGVPIAARPATFWIKGIKWARRRPGIATLLVLVVLSTVSGLAGITWQWLIALQERNNAEKFAQGETREKENAIQARNKAEISLYFSHIAQANSAWYANNVEKAEELLSRCPENLRNWEWDYLTRRCHSYFLTLDGNTCVAFSPVDQRMATASFKNIKVWRSPDFKELLTLSGHEAPVKCVTFSRDGNLLASADGEAVMIWHGAKGTRIDPSGRSIESPTCIAFSPDSRRLAVACERVVKVWDLAKEKEIHALSDHTRQILGVAFSPDGKLLASADGDGVLKLWDAASGKASATLRGHRGAIRQIAFDSAGRYLASVGDDRTTRVWSMPVGTPLHIFGGHTHPLTSLAVSPDGRTLATGDGDEVTERGMVRFWDLESGTEAGVLRGHTEGIKGLAFSRDGQQLATAGENTTRIWRVARDQNAQTLQVCPEGVNAVAFAPDSEHVAAIARDGAVSLWNAATAIRLLRFQAHRPGDCALAFSGNGKHIATGGILDAVKLWDAASGKQIRSLRVNASLITSVVFDPTGTYLAAGSANDDQPSAVYLWKLASGDGPLTLTTGSEVVALAFSLDGKRLASAHFNRTVILWDIPDGKQLHVLRHDSPVTDVAFSPDGTTLASAGGVNRQGEVKLWDIATGREVRTLSGHMRRLLAVAFNKDGTRLASAGWDNVLTLLDPIRGNDVLTISGHTNNIVDVSFSPDGRRIASASLDGTVKVWDATPPKQ